MALQHTDSPRADKYDGLRLILTEIENDRPLCDSLIADGYIDDAIEDDLGTF